MTETFFKYLQYEKRLSKHTLASYRNDLDQFSRYLKITYTGTSEAEANYGMIRSWIITLSEERLQPSSINRKIACLRSFYKFLLSNETIGRDPMAKVTALKAPKRLPSFIKESEINNLLDGQAFDFGFEGQRDKLIIELFYATGIRLAELIGLQEKHIDTKRLTIKVLGKRSKERLIPFPARIVLMVDAYRMMRDREVEKKGHGLLFVTRKGDACYPMLVYRSVNKYLKQATVAEKKSPHILRHTYATHLLDKGAAINAVKDLLGHSSLAATQVYTHNSMEKIKRVFDQAHPKA